MQNIKQKLKMELTAELSNILNYWMKFTFDEVNGGFIGHVNGDNKVQHKASKGAVLNARILWTFSSAYRVTKNEEYKRMADRAYKYIIKYFIDKKNGGVFWELNYLGEPTNKRKQIYALSFTIYGLSEYYRVTGEREALAQAIELFNCIEEYSLDKEKNGYFEALAEDWQMLEDVRLSDKDANERKTMNTHLHILEAYASLYWVHKDEKVRKALKNLIELFHDKFVNSSYNLNLFFDDDWNLKSDEISYGHDIECSWLLHEAAEVLGHEKLLKKVEEVAVNMAKVTFNGLAQDNGLINEAFPSENSFDTDKHWWQQAEAIVGFYNAYQISGKAEFLEKADKVWEYTKTNIIDHKNGEWFWRVNEQNIPYTQDEKTGFWKCPYHNGRACLEIMERIA